MSERQSAEFDAPLRPALTALDFVQMYLDQTEAHPQNGHYVNAVACRRKSPAGRKDDPRNRCTRCDAEVLLRVTSPREDRAVTRATPSVKTEADDA